MNSTKKYDLTVLIPVFNEEENIMNVEKSMNKFLSISRLSTCVLFIDDGSTDNSLELIEKICQNNPDFYFIALENQGGLSSAIKAGFDYASSKYIGYIDADLQTYPEDFAILENYIEDYDLVTGIRVDRKDSLFKKMQSKIANKYRNMMTADGISDTGCPLKIIHSDIAKKIPFFKGMHRFLPALVLLENGTVKQIPVRHRPRQAGKSKYHLWNRLCGPFIDCFAYRWMKKRHIDYKIKSFK